MPENMTAERQKLIRELAAALASGAPASDAAVTSLRTRCEEALAPPAWWAELTAERFGGKPVWS